MTYEEAHKLVFVLPKKYRNTAVFSINNGFNEGIDPKNMCKILQNHANGGEKVDIESIRK